MCHLHVISIELQTSGISTEIADLRLELWPKSMRCCSATALQAHQAQVAGNVDSALLISSPCKLFALLSSSTSCQPRSCRPAEGGRISSRRSCLGSIVSDIPCISQGDSEVPGPIEF